MPNKKVYFCSISNKFSHKVGTFKTFLGKIEKKIFFVKKSAKTPKMNNVTMKKYLTNTVKY